MIKGRIALCILMAFSFWVSPVAFAGTTEETSKINGYGVLKNVGEGASKINGYAVVCCLGPGISKLNAYAVLSRGTGELPSVRILQ